MPQRPIWAREGFRSRRQYENARARRAGFSSYSEYQRLGKDPAYRAMIRALADATGASPRALRQLDSPINRRIADEGLGDVQQDLAQVFGGPPAEAEPAERVYDVEEFDWEEFREFYEETAE